MNTKHTVRVTFHRNDREEPIAAGVHTFEGQDYDTFDDAAARTALIEAGLLTVGPTLVTFGGTIAPLASIDRINVTISSKTRPPSSGA